MIGYLYRFFFVGKRKAFEGEKKPSMKRRLVGHDYTRRDVYMVTMTVERRRPLLRPFFNLQLGTRTYNCIGNRALLTASDYQQMNLMALELSRLKKEEEQTPTVTVSVSQFRLMSHSTSYHSFVFL